MCTAYVSIVLSLQGTMSADDITMHVADSGYMLERRRDQSPVSMMYRRQQDHAGISVRISNVTRDPLLAWRANTETNAKVAERPSVPFSSLPLGDRSTYIIGTGSMSLVCMLERVLIVGQVRYAGVGPRGSVTWQKADEAGDKLLLEGLCRNGFAKAIGRSLTAMSNVNVGGTTITQVMRTSSSVTMVPLAQWALARGIVVNENARLGTFSFTKNGSSFIVPLGAKSVKKGTTWHPLDAPVLKRSNIPYVPLSDFEALL